MQQKRELRLPDEIVPERLVPWEELDDGRVDLMVARYQQGWIARLVQRWLQKPNIRVHLDELGSFVWLRCDGEQNVATITRALEEELDESAELAPERLGMFLQHMQKVELVRLMVPGDAADESTEGEAAEGDGAEDEPTAPPASGGGGIEQGSE